MERRIVSTSGPRGLGTLQRLAAGYRITATEDGDKHKAGQQFGPFPSDRVQEDVRAVLDAGKWKSLSNIYFSVNGNEDFIWDIHPWEGFEYLSFKEFGHRKDKLPVAEPRASFGNMNMEFRAIFEIVDGKFAGLTAPRGYRDYFAENPDNGLVIISGTQVWGDRLAKFLRLAGYTSDDDFEFKPTGGNVLPTLEGILQSKKEVFGGTLEKGWIQNLSYVDKDKRPK